MDHGPGPFARTFRCTALQGSNPTVIERIQRLTHRDVCALLQTMWLLAWNDAQRLIYRVAGLRQRGPAIDKYRIDFTRWDKCGR